MHATCKKIARDLLMNSGRTIIIITALVIGLWGVASVMVSFVILSHDLNQNFQSTIPPQATIVSGDFDRLDLNALRKRPEIEAAELRDFVSLRIETHPGEWIPLWLYGVNDFKALTLAKIYDRPGRGAPVEAEDGTMLIERDGLKFSNLKSGALARIRSGGRIVALPVAGICFDPAQAPGTQDHLIYGYVNKKTFSEITGESANQRLIVRFRNTRSRQEVQAAADRLVASFKMQGIATRTVTIPEFNAHPHQWQLNTLLFLEGSIGFLAFFMGTVLVSQLMASVLAKQIRQIGILKAIGATRFQALQLYLAMVLALGVISSAIAIPLAIRSGYAFAGFVAGIINFEILTLSLPASLYSYLIVAGLFLPVLTALPAILKGTGISVLNALSDYGIIQDDQPLRNKAVTQRFPLPGNLVMAFRNTMRRRKRLVVTLISMALGVAIFDTGFNMVQSIRNTLSDEYKSMRYDVQVVLANQMPKRDVLNYFSGIGNIRRMETWNGGRGALQSGVVSTDAGMVGIVALPYATDLVAFQNVKGRWLNSETEPKMVMNQEAARLYGNPPVGSYRILNFGGKQVRMRLVGIVNQIDKPKIFMDINVYDRIANPGHEINSVMFVAKDHNYDNVMSLKRDIEKVIEPSALHVLYVMMKAERVKILQDHLYIVLVTILFFASLVLTVSAMGMASATSINIMERTREIGVLRAIGATPGAIYRLFIIEGMIISSTSILLGLLMAWPLTVAGAKFLGKVMLDVALRPSFNYMGIAITVIITVTYGLLSSRVPARKAITVSVREALTYE